MKPISALATLALVTLVLEEKGRQVAGEAQSVYGEAVVQARGATEFLRESGREQPVASPGDSQCGWVRAGTLICVVKTPDQVVGTGPSLLYCAVLDLPLICAWSRLFLVFRAILRCLTRTYKTTPEERRDHPSRPRTPPGECVGTP